MHGLSAFLLLTLQACGGTGATPAANHAPYALESTAGPLTIAHRGYSAVAPENTTVAVDLGATAGAEFVEIDVQMSADGGLVVMHDTTLTRTTNAPLLYPARAPWNVGDFTLSEMRGLDAGTWYGYSKEPFNFDYAGEPVPDLCTILDTLRDRAGLLLEVKSPALYPGIESALAVELEGAGWVQDGRPLYPLIVQSFDWQSMHSYAQFHPEVPIGLLGTPPADAATWSQVESYSDWINPSHTAMTPELVADIHRRGLRTSPYTVDDPERMQELLQMGVDGIITNHPLRLKWLLEADVPATGPFTLHNPDITELSGIARSSQLDGV